MKDDNIHKHCFDRFRLDTRKTSSLLGEGSPVVHRACNVSVTDGFQTSEIQSHGWPGL